MTSKHQSTSLLKTSLIAVIAGAGIALLFAPRSGTATRYRLRNRLEQIRKKAIPQHAEPAALSDRLQAWDTEHRQKPVLTKWEEEV